MSYKASYFANNKYLFVLTYYNHPTSRPLIRLCIFPLLVFTGLSEIDVDVWYGMEWCLFIQHQKNIVHFTKHIIDFL